MSEPRTPQVPMVDQNGQPFYPLTQYNQIVMPDNSRWDGSTGSAVELDTTLKVGGKAADAKVTGDALNELKNEKADKTEIPAPYSLPTASATVKGGVMVGNGLAIDANGVLSLALADGDEVSY